MASIFMPFHSTIQSLEDQRIHGMDNNIKIYNIRRPKTTKLRWLSSRPAVVFSQSIEYMC